MALFKNQFYTDDFDQEMLDFIESKGWGLTSEYAKSPDLTDKHLVYGNGVDRFWTSHHGKSTFNGFDYMNKSQFKEKIGMTKELELKFPFKFYHKMEKEPFIAKLIDTGDVVVSWSHEDGDGEAYYRKKEVIEYIKSGTWIVVDTKQKLEELLSTRGEDVIEWLTEKLKEFDKRENIRRELEFATAKRERLDKHIVVLEGKLK